MCIGSAAYYYLEREQNKEEELESTSAYHFLAFFISGKPSSFTSLLPSFF